MGKSNTIKQNITQVILIVFSVVLGLYLSERIEERKRKQQSENLLETIKSEVNDNIRILEDWGLYHQEIHKNLDSLSKSEVFITEFIKDKSVLLNTLLSRNSFMGEFLADDAWDIAKSHPLVVNIDYDKFIILSKIYSQQKVTFEPGFEIFELYKSKDVNLEKEARSNLEIMSSSMKELVAREVQLMYYFREAEKILDLQNDK